MSDEEEESMSEGFSASEEEWKPSKDVRGGESSDDDDSDFEETHLPATASNNSGGTTASGAPRKREPKSRSATKQAAVKKRKPAGQSLRAKLYNKYRPPPKTFPSPSSAGSNSPSASTSRTASKNAQVPNESGEHGNDSSSDSSFEDYLVNPAELDLMSSFFNVGGAKVAQKTPSPAPIFDCNAGIANLSDSGSEDNNESSAEEHTNAKAFDFGNLLDNVNSLERVKETIAKRTAETKAQAKSTASKATANADTAAMDVNSLLALGEAQSHVKADQRRNETDTKPKTLAEDVGPQKLSKTKSTRVKRHTKTRPTSTVVAGDTDDSDWEEVADDAHNRSAAEHSSAGPSESLEICVELPSRHRTKQQKQQQDIELALRRRLNRDLKERQLALHKASLLCHFARSYNYNRLLNNTALMQATLRLLPSANAYPPERGTEIKYYQSLVTWFKTAVQLAAPDLYPEKTAKQRRRIKAALLEQIGRKEACCKQDMTFMFVALLRGMGLQCRLVVNLQPLPMRPAQTDLLSIKLKRDGDQAADDGAAKKAKLEEAKEQATVQEGDAAKSVTKKGDKAKSKDTESSAPSKQTKQKASEERKEEAVAKNRPKSAKAQNLKPIEEKVKNSDKKRVKSEIMQVQPQTKSTETRDSRKNVNPKVESASSGHNAKNVQFAEGELKENKQNSERQTTKQSSIVSPDCEEPARADQREQYASTQPKGPNARPTLSKLKRLKQQTSAENFAANPPASGEDERPSLGVGQTPIARRTRQAVTEKLLKHAAAAADSSRPKPVIQVGSPVVPKLITQDGKTVKTTAATQSSRENATSVRLRETRSRSKSPRLQISPTFLQTKNYKEQFLSDLPPENTKTKRAAAKSPNDKVRISPTFLQQPAASSTRVLRSRQKSNQEGNTAPTADATGAAAIPQLDGADDAIGASQPRKPQLKKLQTSRSREESDEDFQPSTSKRPKKAPKLPPPKTATADRRVLSPDIDEKASKRKSTAVDIWTEVWCDLEEQWVCVDLFKGKIHSVEAIRKAATSSFAYVFAFQNDLSVKDVTARYCPNWTTTVRKSRVDRAWLEAAISGYCGVRTLRDIKEDQELRRIHEEKPMPTAISEYKDNPLYALERHLLKFQAIYPPNAATLGFVRGEPVYSRDCVHTLHSREIWLKQARTVKLGEQPYKIVKARPKWDKFTQTVIKDQPLEIFGYWQTEDYEPPTAENGIVPRNAYGNVDLFKPCMLPKKTVHLKLTGLNRICKKLGIDCANAMVGFDFHQGACHPLFDGFVVCEEFGDQVTAAWYQDQEEQERKEQEKFEARVYGNWKKLIRGLLIRERLKKKYNF